MRQKIINTGKRLRADIKQYKEVLLIFAIYYVIMHAIFHAFCPMILISGLPCAGCGMTRAVFFLLTGQLTRSWKMNPMALPVVLFAVYCALRRWFFGKKVKGLRTGLLLLLLGLVAVYIYRMCTVFPDRPPYVYTSGNFLERTFPFYREMLRRLLGI